MASSRCPYPNPKPTSLSLNYNPAGGKVDAIGPNALKQLGPLAAPPLVPHPPSSNILFPSRDQLLEFSKRTGHPF